VKKPFSLSVKVVIRDGRGRRLLLRRSARSKGNPGRWDLPGGKLETGENFSVGLLREVKEETGLTISISGVLGATESETPNKRIAYLVLAGTTQSGRLHLSDEHDAFVWADRRKIRTLELCRQFRSFV